jgi:hypothetical protein
MSYLLFDAAYTRTLVEIGYEDAARRGDELEAFVRAAAPPPALAAAPRTRRRGNAARALSAPSHAPAAH